MATTASSPAASGPAGSHFEGMVGAHYLLSMLAGAEPRGLPGTTIDRVEFQRAAEGRPLDDVIVHAHDRHGIGAVLEIQVKRTVAFTPTDSVFRSVVDQIVKAVRRPEFATSPYNLAIAIARTSRKVDGAYQEVLAWARQLSSATVFIERIERPGSANDDMRSFVRTFRNNLRELGAPFNDEAVWSILRRLHILVFDFTSQGSASEELAKERAARSLHPSEALQAGRLWVTLTNMALTIASNGGDRTRLTLVEELSGVHQFRLAGDTRNALVRPILAEATQSVLADIGDRIGDVTIARLERHTALYSALDQGRYVEIRGDAGVGKSGILKHFALQLATESRIVALSPGRVISKGWMNMRAALGFAGTAHEFLSDLASDGGATIFVDNLDFFADDERKTVADLVREAANVAGVSIVVTTRRDFWNEEPTWLPLDALERLGRAPSVDIGELSAAEIDELRHAAPKLAALLADDHPARDVARNLFRLSRLASQDDEEPFPRTEVDMAGQWWTSADGRRDEGHRERSRLLRALAEQTLNRVEVMDASACPAPAVDALIRSETLRDFGDDRVGFRHDVLREWATASLLLSETSAVDRLPLGQPAPSSLVRSVELMARMILERSADGSDWMTLVNRLSTGAVHGSWRRAALLGAVRSELGTDLLRKISNILLSNQGAVLRELIRILKAVDVVDASTALGALGVDKKLIPKGLHVPTGRSWLRLVAWSLKHSADIPTAIVPELVDLYATWLSGTFGRDPLTPHILKNLYVWLAEIETDRDAPARFEARGNLSRGLSYEALHHLEARIRATFLVFCRYAPDLAELYLTHVRRLRHSQDIAASILKFRGSLAEAAPATLAKLTFEALVQESDLENRRGRGREASAFSHIDHELLPESPSQGPFLDLLIHAPEHGLLLVRKLVDHAITSASGGREPSAHKVTIELADGPRDFPWPQAYRWSRESNYYSVTSALMALEFWAHDRLEAGQPFVSVLADVLGARGTSAAHLLVGVDLLLSHWPKSREAAVPFLGCPELLVMDRERKGHDDFKSPIPDFLGLGAIEPREPQGRATLQSLKNRPSRRLALEDLMGQYSVYGPTELRDLLNNLLQNAAIRLGRYDKTADFSSPAFMTAHVLNILNPENWEEVPHKRADGTEVMARRYVPPLEERDHIAPQMAEVAARSADTHLQVALADALDDKRRSSPELAEQGVLWSHKPPLTDGEEGEIWPREHSFVIAATIAIRDGTPQLRAEREQWARKIFALAISATEDPVHRMRSGLRYNPMAIAAVGMIHMLKYSGSEADTRSLLELAARDDPAAAHGFGAAVDVLAEIDARLPRAALRCAFYARIRPRRELRTKESDRAKWKSDHRRLVMSHIRSELLWLSGKGAEPEWPTFPTETVRPRRNRIRLPGGKGEPDRPTRPRPRSTSYVDHQAAALWLRQIAPLYETTNLPWLRNLAQFYSAWTAQANGAGLEDDEEVADNPSEWNRSYYQLLAACSPGLTSNEIGGLAIEPICSLPDEPFFDVAANFLPNLDQVYFGNRGMETASVVHIRSAFASRLMASQGWRWVRGKRSSSIEIHIGPAIAALFMNEYGSLQPPKCYLLSKGIDRLGPFLPVLAELVETGASIFVALVSLNLLEVSPKVGHLSFLTKATKAWLVDYADDSGFWVEHEIGKRVCALFDAIGKVEPGVLASTQPLRSDIDYILAALVRAGVPEARRLEEDLASRDQS